MKTALVLEGGAFRTIFSSGVCDAFLDAGLPMPDYTVGVSAGMAYGVSYLSRQKRRNLKLLMHYANDRRYMGLRNWINPRNRCYFGLEFAYETIPNRLVPFDYDTFAAYPGLAEAVVTDLTSGRAAYLQVPRRDDKFLLLQATCAIPLLFPPIVIDGVPYLDGGCADAIPWRRALELGCDRLVVVLTRERGYRKQPDHAGAVMERAFRKYPAFLHTLSDRAERYNRCREELFALEKAGKALVIAPKSTQGFSRMERDTRKILALWQDGYFAGRDAAGAVRQLWTSDSSV
ncbi:patatin-like phospholipase family protein [Dysosmobacter sp.]|uniref:patatin-like phospholipase family protein n=1 Tax=Dysosmobacter sp. TaxID=2591382 RepID=UPI001BB47176|nr:patatin family protein [Dysosmobacter sp.]MCI6055607.1 patatin family protein [Dysosmobacter sp.]MDY5511226.1 patatin family protein [Dysosmobacter sp.]QUO36984.1 patatin family protein [Dysosmobacter sp. Marseille-Q4140]